jgi:hypothetical protein
VIKSTTVENVLFGSKWHATPDKGSQKTVFRYCLSIISLAARAKPSSTVDEH